MRGVRVLVLDEADCMLDMPVARTTAFAAPASSRSGYLADSRAFRRPAIVSGGERTHLPTEQRASGTNGKAKRGPRELQPLQPGQVLAVPARTTRRLRLRHLASSR